MNSLPKYFFRTSDNWEEEATLLSQAKSLRGKVPRLLEVSVCYENDSDVRPTWRIVLKKYSQSLPAILFDNMTQSSWLCFRDTGTIITDDCLFRAAIFLPCRPHPSPSLCQSELRPVWLICDVALHCQLRHPSKQTNWQTRTHRRGAIETQAKQNWKYISE